jgi:hypothetical protein
MSSCQGKKKALLIGINYKGTSSALSGCINDVHAIRDFLMKNRWPSDDRHILCLVDDSPQPHLQPTRQNILEAMRWLVRGATAGDSLFFHFSGHGATVEDKDGDEQDGLDDTICPVDYARAGMIVDDEMNHILVKALPAQVRLTALFDCCHSGSALDLPFTYHADGQLKTNDSALKRIAGGGKNIGMNAMRGNFAGAMSGAMSLVKSFTSGSGMSSEQRQQLKGNAFADVIMLSGCKDAQTSADAAFNGMAGGAMTYAFIETMKQFNGACSYGMLLGRMREVISSQGHSQKPQLSSARYMDMNQGFLI